MIDADKDYTDYIEVFEKVIEKKVTNDVSASSICKALKLEEEEILNYFLGITKADLELGKKILNYLEKKEK